MTRKVTKSVMCSVVLALLIVLAMGIDEVFADHEQDRLLQDFGELLEGKTANLLTTHGETEPAIDASTTIGTGLIVPHIAFLEAFDEVIQKQII